MLVSSKDVWQQEGSEGVSGRLGGVKGVGGWVSQGFLGLVKFLDFV